MSKKDIKNKILRLKKPIEANTVASLWKEPNLYLESGLQISDFSTNEWKTYYAVGGDIVINGKKMVLDEITVNIHLEQNSGMAKAFNGVGGYQIIDDAKQFIKTENFEGYRADLDKMNLLLSLVESDRFNLTEELLDDYLKMSANDIYMEYEAEFNHIAIETSDGAKTVSILDGIEETMGKYKRGEFIGMPYYNMNYLNSTTGGRLEGNVTLIGGMSNVGKTAFVVNTIMAQHIQDDERLVMLLNEEGKDRWQLELIVWVANNIYHESSSRPNINITKKSIKNWNINDEEEKLINDCIQWLKDNLLQEESGYAVTLVMLPRFSTDEAIKHIRKYANLGVDHFVLDTFKYDYDADPSYHWFDMQQNMVKLHNTVKNDGGLGVHLTCTFQLSTKSFNTRYFTQANIGGATGIIHPVSTIIMIRDMFDDEFDDRLNTLEYYNVDIDDVVDVDNESVKYETVSKDINRKHQVVFCIKSRFDAPDKYQIITHNDLGRNRIKELGITHVEQDF